MSDEVQPTESAPLVEEDGAHGGAVQDGAQNPFSSAEIRSEFVRAALSLQSCQLALTLGIGFLTLFVDALREFAQDFPWLVVIFVSINFILLIVLALCNNFRRNLPVNLILICVYGLIQGLTLGTVSAYENTDALLIVVGVALIIVLGLAIFTLQPMLQLSYLSGSLLALILTCSCYGGLCAAFQSRYLYLACFCLGAFIFGLYIVLDVMFMIDGKHSYPLSPDEYIFAALNLHLDSVHFVRYGIEAIIAKIRGK